MKVKNQRCIHRLSFKSLWASRKRNLIAVFAITLTTLLFTSLFTIVMSLNASYETYQFRQIGGYAHGTFKDVSLEQLAAISGHKNVKQTGARTMIGTITEGVFAKVPAEVSYMDDNCSVWSYAEPETGRMPQKGREVSMDTAALKLLGIEPEIGAQIPLTYMVGDKDQTSFAESGTFTLVGYWEYDNLMPVHYINISQEYQKEIEEKGREAGMEPFRLDLNVMLASSVDIRGQMEQVDTDLGYTWETRDEENSVRIGVNWGYTSSQVNASLDYETVIGMAAFLVLVIFTGYLIIYNIFQISVSGDIRFYGLLKTIGTTPRQLRRIIRLQALLLCLMGIPAGLLLGYTAGGVLTPVILKSLIVGDSAVTISSSPIIFAAAAAFALLTVLLSSARPGRIAGKVSPVEAVRYTDNLKSKKKKRAYRGAKVHQMAFANLGRNKTKTLLVVISLSLSVTLLNVLCMFVRGFDIEKYVSSQTIADFIVSTTDYFRFEHAQEYISEEMIQEIQKNTNAEYSGCAYKLSGMQPKVWMEEEILRSQYLVYNEEDMVDAIISSSQKRDGLVLNNAMIEGMDESLIEKLNVIEGSLEPMYEKDSNAIAVVVQVDDYGNVYDGYEYPEIGDTVTMKYIQNAYLIDSTTGEMCDENTPEENMEFYIESDKETDYTVCALVDVPYKMSYRYYTVGGISAVLPAERLKEDSGQELTPLLYLFDTPDETAEAEAETYLARLTADDLSTVMYESKATIRADFQSFGQMFLLIGGFLCAIIALVGILNFFNAIMTGIISRRREFAVLQSVGMTNRQLRMMLIYEGLFYALSSVTVAFVLSLILQPLTSSLFETMFWFFVHKFTIEPVLIVTPVFVLLGWLIPAALYGQSVKQSVVERLREAE